MDCCKNAVADWTIMMIGDKLLNLTSVCFNHQGSERALKSWAARLVLWLSLTFGLLLYTAYSATLISNLTVQHSTYPFLSLEQLLQSQYSVCVVRHSAAHAVLQVRAGGYCNP
jgi:hypothetical protein